MEVQPAFAITHPRQSLSLHATNYIVSSAWIKSGTSPGLLHYSFEIHLTGCDSEATDLLLLSGRPTAIRECGTPDTSTTSCIIFKIRTIKDPVRTSLHYAFEPQSAHPHYQ